MGSEVRIGRNKIVFTAEAEFKATDREESQRASM